MLIACKGNTFWHKVKHSNILLPFLLGGISASSFIFSLPSLLVIGHFLFVLLLHNKTFKVADRVGLSYGFAYYLIGLYWFFVVDQNYETTSRFVLVGFEMLAIILMSIQFALLGVFLTVFPKNKRSSILWFVAIVAPSFTLLEWVKTWYFSGFPWFQASHILTYNYLSGWYAVLGEIGVSFLFYLFVSLLVFAFINAKKFKVSLIILAIFALFLLSSSYLGKITYTKNSSNELLIQVFSDGIGSTKKHKISDRVEAVKEFQRMALSQEALDLSVWPESSAGIGEYDDLRNHLTSGFKQLTEKGIEVLFGSYSKKGLQHKNSLFEGQAQTEVYAKQHLVPVGEYIPEWFAILDFWIPGSFQSSTVSDPSLGSSINIKGINFAPMICYEVMFGDEVRKRANNSNLLIGVGNLGALKPLWVKKYFWNLARIRSLELQKPMIQSNSFAYAGFISSKGKTDSFYADTRSFKVKKVQPVAGLTPYARYGFSVILIISSILLCVGIIGLSFRLSR